MGRKTRRRRKRSYWFESQSWHCLIAWLQVNGRSLIKNVILIAELSYLLKKRGLYQQRECSYHLERLELAYELPFLLKKDLYIYSCVHHPAGKVLNSKLKEWGCYARLCCFGQDSLPQTKVFLLLKRILASALSNSQPIQHDRHMYPTHLASGSKESHSTKLICTARWPAEPIFLYSKGKNEGRSMGQSSCTHKGPQANYLPLILTSGSSIWSPREKSGTGDISATDNGLEDINFAFT